MTEGNELSHTLAKLPNRGFSIPHCTTSTISRVQRGASRIIHESRAPALPSAFSGGPILHVTRKGKEGLKERSPRETRGRSLFVENQVPVTYIPKGRATRFERGVYICVWLYNFVSPLNAPCDRDAEIFSTQL